MDRVTALFALYGCTGLAYLALAGADLATAGFDAGSAGLALGGLFMLVGAAGSALRPDAGDGFRELAERDWFFWMQAVATLVLVGGVVLQLR